MQQVRSRPTFDWSCASYEQAEVEVQHWGDRQGREIDPLILSVVVTLNLVGIPTCQSCEGHLDHGLAYPWVMFDRPICPCYEKEWRVCENMDESDELAAYHASDRLQEAMAHCPHRPAPALQLDHLLSLFYARPSASDPLVCRLIVEYTGATFYRLLPIVTGNLSESNQQILIRCQDEMARFASFLKEHHAEIQRKAL